MLDLLGKGHRLCDGIDRRSFLRVGSLGLSGLSLPGLLAARESNAAMKDTAVILFWMAGGPSHHDTFDPKPEAISEVRGPFKAIGTNVAGLQVTELLPELAKRADRYSLVRSLHHKLGVHDDASHWVQTGYPLLNARANGQQHPAQGAVVSALSGPRRAGMPAYVCIPESYRRHLGFYQGASYLGGVHDPVDGGGDPALGNYAPPEFTLPRSIPLARAARRRDLHRSLDGLNRELEQSVGAGALDPFQEKAFELVLGADVRKAFDVSAEPDALKQRYGQHAFGQGALLARRLVEAGVTFVTINLYEKDVDWWDDHYVIEKNLRKRLPPFDRALSTLLDDLKERGLAEKVLVAAFGEFGRGPRIDSYAGRSHWPGAMTAFLSGGGLRGGCTVGATSADGGEPSDRPLTPGDLLATIYRVVGIDPTATVQDRLGRPNLISNGGAPIAELF